MFRRPRLTRRVVAAAAESPEPGGRSWPFTGLCSRATANSSSNCPTSSVSARGPQFDSALPGVESGQLEGAFLQALVPQGETVGVPVERLQPVTAARTEEEQVARERVLAGHHAGQLGQAVEAAAHVRRLSRQPDP